MMVSDSPLSRGAIATRSRWSDRQRSVPTAVGPGTPHPRSGPRGLTRAAPLLISTHLQTEGRGRRRRRRPTSLTLPYLTFNSSFRRHSSTWQLTQADANVRLLPPPPAGLGTRAPSWSGTNGGGGLVLHAPSSISRNPEPTRRPQTEGRNAKGKSSVESPSSRDDPHGRYNRSRQRIFPADLPEAGAMPSRHSNSAGPHGLAKNVGNQDAVMLCQRCAQTAHAILLGSCTASV